MSVLQYMGWHHIFCRVTELVKGVCLDGDEFFISVQLDGDASLASLLHDLVIDGDHEFAFASWATFKAS